jgi:hypothetical protein
VRRPERAAPRPPPGSAEKFAAVDARRGRLRRRGRCHAGAGAAPARLPGALAAAAVAIAFALQLLAPRRLRERRVLVLPLLPLAVRAIVPAVARAAAAAAAAAAYRGAAAQQHHSGLIRGTRAATSAAAAADDVSQSRVPTVHSATRRAAGVLVGRGPAACGGAEWRAARQPLQRQARLSRRLRMRPARSPSRLAMKRLRATARLASTHSYGPLPALISPLLTLTSPHPPTCRTPCQPTLWAPSPCSSPSCDPASSCSCRSRLRRRPSRRDTSRFRRLTESKRPARSPAWRRCSASAASACRRAGGWGRGEMCDTGTPAWAERHRAACALRVGGRAAGAG